MSPAKVIIRRPDPNVFQCIECGNHRSHGAFYATVKSHDDSGPYCEDCWDDGTALASALRLAEERRERLAWLEEQIARPFDDPFRLLALSTTSTNETLVTLRTASGVRLLSRGPTLATAIDRARMGVAERGHS